MLTNISPAAELQLKAHLPDGEIGGNTSGFPAGPLTETLVFFRVL